MDSIEIEDIGNCIIKGFTDDGDYYYLLVRTILGITRIFQIGPLQDGVNTICYCYFQQIDYDDRKIDKIIDKFVDGKISFTQIEVIDTHCKDDYLTITNSLPDVREFLYD